MPFSNSAFWPTPFCACAAPSGPMRKWSRFSYPAPLPRDSCYLLDHENQPARSASVRTRILNGYRHSDQSTTQMDSSTRIWVFLTTASSHGR
jgi:hypothetical protein